MNSKQARAWWFTTVGLPNTMGLAHHMRQFVTLADGVLVFGPVTYTVEESKAMTRKLGALPWPHYVVVELETPLAFAPQVGIPWITHEVAVAVIDDSGAPDGFEAEYYAVCALLRAHTLRAFDFVRGDDPDDGTPWTGTLVCLAAP